MAGLTGCGESGEATADAGRLSVVASFYPLQFVAERVTAGYGDVANLTKPGAEPHDLELSPDDVAEISDADLVVYLSGFQPSVDDAVQSEAADSSIDVRDAADLDLTYTPIEEGEAQSDEAGAVDPHFWLDPTRLAKVAGAVAGQLAKVDPAHAGEYAAAADSLASDLRRLDAEFADKLSDCANRDLVTSHNAFGYLARRYGLTQVGIAGLSPDQEPTPADLASVTDFVRQHGVHTIYYETLVSPAVAKTVAMETGATTAVLDPLEGLTDESQGRNYLAVMRNNLANIEKGQPCP